MEIATAGTTKRDEESAVDAAVGEVRSEFEGTPDLFISYATVEYDVEAVHESLKSRAGTTSIHGATSCAGVMTESGMFSDEGIGFGLLGISDDEGEYGVGAAELGEEPRTAAKRALQRALSDAERMGEVPQLIWVTGAPGAEEEWIAGIEDLLGPDVPIMGGSSADNDVAGNWHQFANGEIYTDAVVVTAMFPSTEVGFSFHSGYEPTENRGMVTEAEGRRLYEINGEPAVEVYNDWTSGAIDDELDGGNVLEKTTLHPIAREVGKIEETPYFQLSHPERVTDDGALALFTSVEEGDELVAMTGTVDSLATRAGRVAEAALEVARADHEDLAGALVVYCAGCVLTVQDRIDEVTSVLDESLGGRPFLGTFTFGEQGCFIGGENRHANLMISVLTFYND